MPQITQSVVFIDANVSDLHHLVDGVLPSISVQILKQDVNGITQISDYLRAYPASTVHIVSHGAPGSLFLGNSQLNLTNLEAHANALASWFSAENSASTLLVYGCNVAAGDAGAEFIEKLHRLTGAKLGASTQPIGNGTWHLNTTYPQFPISNSHFPSPLSSSLLTTYSHTLSAITVTNASDTVNGDTSSIAGLIANNGGDGISLREAILAANNTAGDDTITFGGVFTDGDPTNDKITLAPGSPLNLLSNITISGSGGDPVTISGNNASRVFAIGSGVTVTLNALTIADGFAFNFGGGIDNQGTLSLSNSTLRGNLSNEVGGGINNGGTITSLSNTTFSGNSATYFGGGLSNGGTIISLSNNTFSGNSAANGGGIHNFTNIISLSNTTFSGNSATNGGGINNDGTITTANNLFADSSLRNLLPDATNLVGTAASLGLDPVLRDNGGPTQTHALLAGSIAIDAGSNAALPLDTLDLDNDGNTTEPIPFDQRSTGFARISGGTVDIGAFEFMPLIVNNAPIGLDPTTPTLVGTYNTPGLAFGVSVVGSYAYVADYASGLQVIDISTPSSPILVGTYNTPGNAFGVSVVGSYAYVVDYASGLQVIDISTPSSPILVGTYNTPGAALGVSVVGSYAYVADGNSGLQVIDISTPSSPILVDNTPGAAYGYGVSVVGSYAYVAGGGSGLQVIDISTPSSPILVGTFDTPGAARGVSVVGTYAYVADNASGLQVIDISTPSSSTLVGTYNTPGAAYGLSVVGSYAYVADGGSGLQVIDLSPPITLTGTPQEDSPLTANVSTLFDADGLPNSNTYSYQWQQSNDGGSTWASISGANASTFTPGDDQVGKQVRAQMQYTDLQGTLETITSAPTSAVANVNDAPTVGGRGNADKVAILGAEPDSPYLNDVVAKMQSTGLFTAVDSFAVNSVTPTLAQLQTYDSILVFSNGNFANATALGDSLANYVDAGGGVVLNTFAFNTPLAGRWSTGNYTPIQIASNSAGTPLTLGTVFDPNHPILQGVTSFSGGSNSYHNTGDANSNAAVIANWSNGRPLVVNLETFNGGIVGLNFFPPSSDARSDFWSASTDGEWLMGNALEYVGNFSGVTASATEDNAPFTVDLLAGASDVDGDSLNVSDLVLTGGSVAGVIVNGNSLTVDPNAYNSLAGGAKEIITYTYNIIDGQGGSVAQTATITINGIDDAPTAANLVNTTTTLNENIDTTSALKVADIAITDVDGGNNLSLTGADAASFTLVNSALYLKAGVALNFEAKSSYSVNVVVDAPGVGANPDFTLPFTLTVANVNEALTGSVTITGTATQGQTLTASNDLTDPDGIPGAITYQWKADGTNIDGATTSTLLLTQAQVGKAITVAASYTDGFGQAESVTSTATSVVANINDAPTGTVTITGTATQGQTLTSANTLTDVDGIPGAITYQWKADGTNINGATTSTLLLTQAQVGKAITVAASYPDSFGQAESVTSAATTAVANINDLPTGAVTLSGITKHSYTLTADASTVQDVDGLGTFSYQWQQSSNGTTWSNIPGATETTFLLTAAQVGQQVRSQVSYTDGQGTAEVLSSAPTSQAIRPFPVGEDLNGNGTADILWRHQAVDQTVFWLMNNTTFASGNVLQQAAGDANWKLKAVTDLDGDRDADLLWQHATSGQGAYWLMQGTTFVSGDLLPDTGDANWKLVNTGDFNGDDQTDLFWRHATSGQNAVWLMNGPTLQSAQLLDPVADLDWEIGAVGDFTKNGQMEIFWRHRTSGEIVLWDMNGTTRQDGYLIGQVDPQWRMVGASDFTGDAKLDLLWQHTTADQLTVWQMDGLAVQSAITITAPPAAEWLAVI